MSACRYIYVDMSVCMYIYVHRYECMHVHMYRYECMYVHIRRYECMYVHIQYIRNIVNYWSPNKYVVRSSLVLQLSIPAHTQGECHFLYTMCVANGVYCVYCLSIYAHEVRTIDLLAPFEYCI